MKLRKIVRMSMSFSPGLTFLVYAAHPRLRRLSARTGNPHAETLHAGKQKTVLVVHSIRQTTWSCPTRSNNGLTSPPTGRFSSKRLARHQAGQMLHFPGQGA